MNYLAVLATQILNTSSDAANQNNIDLDKLYTNGGYDRQRDPDNCICDGNFERFDGYPINKDQVHALRFIVLSNAEVMYPHYSAGGEEKNVVVIDPGANVYTNVDYTKDNPDFDSSSNHKPVSFYPPNQYEGSLQPIRDGFAYAYSGNNELNIIGIYGQYVEGSLLGNLAHREHRSLPNHWMCRSVCESIESFDKDGHKTAPCIGYQVTNDFVETTLPDGEASADYDYYQYDVDFDGSSGSIGELSQVTNKSDWYYVLKNRMGGITGSD